MARPQTNTVEYFSHDASASGSDTVTALESKYGHTGYAVWFKLLEKLAGSEDHYIDCRNEAKVAVMATRWRISVEEFYDICNLLVEMDALDRELWDLRIIYCEKLVYRLRDVYANRRRELPQKPLSSMFNQRIKGQATSKLPVESKAPKADNLTTPILHGKGKERKGKETITPYNPPGGGYR